MKHVSKFDISYMHNSFFQHGSAWHLTKLVYLQNFEKAESFERQRMKWRNLVAW